MFFPQVKNLTDILFIFVDSCIHLMSAAKLPLAIYTRQICSEINLSLFSVITDSRLRERTQITGQLERLMHANYFQTQTNELIICFLF